MKNEELRMKNSSDTVGLRKIACARRFFIFHSSFFILLFFLSSAQAQVRVQPGSLGDRTGSIGHNSNNRNSNSTYSGNTNNPASPNDTTFSQTDTSATKGLVFAKEIPDSVLKQKVFLFHHHTARLWIDEVWNPTLDPTGAQFHDPLDALNGNYYLGKGSLGHPHVSLFPTLADALQLRLQPDLYPGYAFTFDNIYYYQTLTPFSLLNYGGSLAKDHSLTLGHTQNVLPGWNVAFNYRLFNPEGVYASSGALNNYLTATTNYFSRDSRLQASAALIWQSFNIDENGGLSNDDIFIYQRQSNRAGIPVNLTGAGSLQRNFAATGSVSYSLERQSDTYRHRDSLNLVQVNDSTTRLDTLDIVDTIPLRTPRVLNWGAVGLDLKHDRQKRVFTDSTLWREQVATLFWTNDAYTTHRWHNPLRITVGLHPRRIMAVIPADTLRSATWLNPFAHIELALWKATLRVEAEQYGNRWSRSGHDRRIAARLTVPFDSAGLTYASLEGVVQHQSPYLLMAYDYMNSHGGQLPASQTIQRYTLRFKHKEQVDFTASASHLSHNLWYDSTLTLHEGTHDFWLLQASLLLRLAAGPFHLDMQQLVQYSTDPAQMPVPLWASKNSLYADFPLFHGTLRVQTGVDLRYHTSYHAPFYDPATGLFLQQDTYTVGNYLWADVFINLQVKRASIYLKAGHVNALWENPATYFLLPHYPGEKFGLLWGITWCFFD